MTPFILHLGQVSVIILTKPVRLFLACTRTYTLQEEAAQSKALDMLLMKKTQGTVAASPKSSVRDSLNLEDDWVIPEAGT